MKMDNNIEGRVFDYLQQQCTKNEEVVPYTSFSGMPIDYTPDMYLPYGLSAWGIKGKTVVEIKRNVYPSSLHRLEVQSRRLLTEGWKVLAIFFDVKDSLQKQLNNKGRELSFHYRCLTRKELLNYNPRDKYAELEYLACKAFNNGPVTLFVGSGVSQDMGLPSWSELLKGLYNKCDRNLHVIGGLAFDDLIKDCNHSFLILARTIREAFENEDDFYNAIHDVLYKTPNSNSKKRKNGCDRHVLDVIREWAKEDYIENIITYNYDDLIERELRRANKLYHTIYGESEPGNGLTICHVHGFIPFNNSCIESSILFSEEQYHNVYQQSYSWSNVEQLYALKRSHCFFIGLSMNDPNLRRLLDISQSDNQNKEECKHFVFMREEGIKEKLSTESDGELYKQHYEDVMSGLGVRVIWYKEHKDLPEILDKIAKLRAGRKGCQCGFKNRFFAYRKKIATSKD